MTSSQRLKNIQRTKDGAWHAHNSGTIQKTAFGREPEAVFSDFSELLIRKELSSVKRKISPIESQEIRITNHVHKV